MKKWENAQLVELNIAETANGRIDSILEFSHNGWGWNNDLVDGNDSDGDGFPSQDTGKGDTSSSTPTNRIS